MTTDRSKLTDSVTYRLLSGDDAVTEKELYVPEKVRPNRLVTAQRHLKDKINFSGFVVAILRGPDGRIKQVEQGANLITDHGDEHAARRLFDDAIDIVTGMRLGDQVAPTAAAKSGAGAAIEAYLTGSNELLDAAATHSDLGGGSGYRATYICTWVAGDITDPAISEVVLSDENPLTDVAGAVGDTVARFIFGSTIDKQAGDSLEVTWNNDALGA